MARIQNAPKLQFENDLTQRTLGRAYDDALDNLLRINTIADADNKHDKSGLMSNTKLFIKAGGGYDEPWTRDASINSWNAGSLLEPSVARNTLWAVCEKQRDGNITLQRDNQWWDKVIWITAAWNHYKVTGDREFLRAAYGAAQDELKLTRTEYFNPTQGLFRGPAVFADGIAAYPAPIYEPTSGSSFVLDYPNSQNIMALSTNCVYYAGNVNAANMAAQLGRPASEIKAYNDAAAALRIAINGKLWNADKDTYDYFVYGSGPKDGQRDATQEGIGLSFAILMGVASPDQSASILKNAHISPNGITTEFPHFARFSDEKPGRHNVMVWQALAPIFEHKFLKSLRRFFPDRAAQMLQTGGLGFVPDRRGYRSGADDDHVHTENLQLAPQAARHPFQSMFGRRISAQKRRTDAPANRTDVDDATFGARLGAAGF